MISTSTWLPSRPSIHKKIANSSGAKFGEKVIFLSRINQKVTLQMHLEFSCLHQTLPAIYIWVFMFVDFYHFYTYLFNFIQNRPFFDSINSRCTMSLSSNEWKKSYLVRRHRSCGHCYTDGHREAALVQKEANKTWYFSRRVCQHI